MRFFRYTLILGLLLLVAVLFTGCGEGAEVKNLREQAAQTQKRLDNLGQQYKELQLANDELKTALILVRYRLVDGKTPEELTWLFFNALQHGNGSLARIFVTDDLRENFSSTLQLKGDPALNRFSVMGNKAEGSNFRCTARLWFSSGDKDVAIRDDELVIEKVDGIYLINQVITGKERLVN